MGDFIENFEKAFGRLQGVADELWQLLDEFSPSLVLSAEQSHDPIEAFRQLRGVHAALQSIAQPLSARANTFNEKLENFKLDIDKSARNVGIKRLPDEVLLDILDRAARSLQTSMLLSHVCKRFHRTIRPASVFWNGSYVIPRGTIFGTKTNLNSNMPPSIIPCIVERCRAPLKAEIPVEPAVPVFSDSVKTIMEFGSRLDELTISCIRYEGIPPPLTFPGDFRLPFLRTLNCEFIPHPSLSRNIVHCNINFICSKTEVSLKHLLEFLSSAGKLERLSLNLGDNNERFRDQDTAEPLDCISLPSLSALRLENFSKETTDSYVLFTEKLSPFAVSELSLQSSYTARGNPKISSFLGFVQERQVIRDLRLELSHPLPYIPQHIETLYLSGNNVMGDYVGGTIQRWLHCPESFPARNLRLLSLRLCNVRSIDVLRLRAYFVKSGYNQVRFEFWRCKGMEDGIYELSDIHIAVLD